MKALILAALLSQAVDAPEVVTLTPAEAKAVANDIRACQTGLANATDKLNVCKAEVEKAPKYAPVILVIAIAASAAATGFGIGFAVGQKTP